MKKKLFIVLALALSMIFIVTATSGCSPAAEDPAEEPVAEESAAEEPATEEPAADSSSAGGELITVGIINNDPNESGYRTANDADLKATFTQENGYDASFSYSMKNDEQITFAQKFVQDGVDYLLVSAADTTGWDTVLKDAQAAGVKVILFDRTIDADPSLYEASIVSDMEKEGADAVAWLKNQSLDSYKVIHLQGVMGSAAQKGRTGAIDEEFSAGTMDKVDQQTAEWNAEKAQQIVQAAIDAKKDFNVIYAENDDMAKGAVAALDAAGISHGKDGDVVVMGFDCNKWALEELLAGAWNYDGQCNPFQGAYIDEIIKGLQGGTPPAEKIVIMDEKGFDANTITQEDVDTYGI
jgi:simple sugar transport system substrate-binding protein